MRVPQLVSDRYSYTPRIIDQARSTVVSVINGFRSVGLASLGSRYVYEPVTVCAASSRGISQVIILYPRQRGIYLSPCIQRIKSYVEARACDFV